MPYCILDPTSSHSLASWISGSNKREEGTNILYFGIPQAIHLQARSEVPIS